MAQCRQMLQFVGSSFFLIITLLIAMGQSSPVSAMALTAAVATIHTVGDTCGVTIQACIDVAAPGDTVRIPAGTYTESLLLNKAVSLTGVNSATTVIQAPMDQRVLLVTGANINNAVVVSGLTLTGGKGYASEDACLNSYFCGGGILVKEGASPRLLNLSIVGNTATYGGGMFISADSHPLLVGLTVSNNSATSYYGGGLYAAGTLEIQHTQFISNFIGFGRGGGAYVEGNLTVIGGRFLDNKIDNGVGGGLYVKGMLALTNVQFVHNGDFNQSRSMFGGGVYAEGATTIAGSVFMNNFAHDGAGLYVTQALTVTDSEFISNTATSSGGGFFATGKTQVVNSRFVNNIANFYYGGGLNVSNPLGTDPSTGLTLSDSEFAANVALGGGGGAYVSGPITVTNALFTDNVAGSADNIASYGGGGLANLGSATLTHTTFIHNTVYGSGGGASLGNSFQTGVVVMNGARFEDNVAGGEGLQRGGGLYAMTGEVRLSDIEFISNTSTYDGGGASIYSSADPNVLNVVANARFERNVTGGTRSDYIASGYIPGGGGGLYVAGNVIFTDVILLENSAIGSGGGAAIDGTATLENGQFIDNKTGNFGGGLAIVNALHLRNARFMGNQAVTGGGGLYGSALPPSDLKNVHFEGNTTTSGDGGGLVAISANENYLVSLDTGTFISNTASGNGGGLYLLNGDVTTMRFQGNRAGQNGGGAYFGNWETISNTIFVENVGGGYGGGVAAFSANLTGVQFIHNQAGYGGGFASIGFHSAARTDMVDLTNALFARNVVTGTGAAFHMEAGNASLKNVTIADVSINPYPALYFKGACGTISGCDSLTLHNSILTNHAIGLNIAPSIGVEEGNVEYYLDYDLFFGVTKPISATVIKAGEHNLKADPLFVAPASGNYQLLPTSLAIDHADAANCPPIDVAGNPRPQGLGCDMGAYEAAPVLPIIELAPSGLNFITMQGVAQPPAQPVQVKNIGAGLLSWNAIPAVSWLSATPGSSGSLGNVNIGVNHNNLAIGSHTGNVVMSSNALNPSVSLPVTVEVLSACTPLLANGNFESTEIVWSQSTSTGGTLIQPNSNLVQYVTPRPGSQAVLLGSQDGQSSDLSQSIKIPAGAPLSLRYAYFIKSSESSCGEDEVQVRFGNSVVGNHLLCQSNNTVGWQQRTLDLSPFANQRGDLTFHLENDPIGTPSVFLLDDAAITVTSSVNCSVSSLQVAPTALTFSTPDSNTPPASQSLTIHNSGAAVLNWTASTTNPWFYLDTSQGTTPAIVNVSVTPSGLSNGVHNGQITVESPGASDSPKVIDVVLTIGTISGASTLQASPTMLTFTANSGAGNPPNQKLTISNGGSGVLNWKANEALAWLSLDAANGTAPATLTVTVDASALALGSHSGNIILSSPGTTGSPQVISVSLTVVEGSAGGKIYLPLVSR